MVDTELLQDRGVDVVNGDRVLGDRFAEVVGRSVRHAFPDAAAGQKDRVAVDVVIAAVPARAVRRASHFAGPHHECLVQQPALPEIANQRRDGLFGDAGVLLVIRLECPVLVPGGVVAVEAGAGDLDEAHSRFHQSPGAERLQRIIVLMLVRRTDAIQGLDVSRLALISASSGITDCMRNAVS
jgi:hypothetical protein